MDKRKVIEAIEQLARSLEGAKTMKRAPYAEPHPTDLPPSEEQTEFYRRELERATGAKWPEAKLKRAAERLRLLAQKLEHIPSKMPPTREQAERYRREYEEATEQAEWLPEFERRRARRSMRRPMRESMRKPMGRKYAQQVTRPPYDKPVHPTALPPTAEQSDAFKAEWERTIPTVDEVRADMARTYGGQNQNRDFYVGPDLTDIPSWTPARAASAIRKLAHELQEALEG